MKLVIIYRPPPSKKNKHSYADFLVEFTGFIEHYALMTTRFAIVGDFNIHWDVPSDTNVKRFADLLESLNIIQHVHAPTHIDGHTIDLILTPSGNHAITSTKTTLLLFDHLGVEYLVDMEKPVVPRKTITYRKYKAINKPVFCSDIALSLPTAISSGKQTTELANHYNVVLTKLIEKHAPLQTCRIADRPLVPWCNKNVIKAKQIRRQCERKWRHTSLQVHRDLYKTQCAEVKRTIIKAKSDYYTSEIEQCGCDNRRLYRLLNGLLQRRKSHYLPVNNNIHELALRFSTFFSAKIETIRVAFHSHSTLASSSTRDHRPAPWVSRLELFPTATSDIHSLLIKSPTTSCVLDPLPTWLLKDVSDNAVPFLTKLINSSIASGVVPCCLKHANVTPVHKKANIDQDNMNSYRPISNVPFISKLLERYACLIT